MRAVAAAIVLIFLVYSGYHALSAVFGRSQPGVIHVPRPADCSSDELPQ